MYRKLDLLDKKILYFLDIDSRMPASGIARKTGIAKETVNFRIKKLLEKGIVTKFYTIINTSYFGFMHHLVFFKFNKISKKKEDSIISFLRKKESMTSIRILEGNYDLCFVCAHKNVSDLNYFLREFLEKFGKFVFLKDVHTITRANKANQRFIKGKESGLRSFDLLQKQIKLKHTGLLRILSRDSRKNIVDISRELKTDARKVSYRIRKLKESGVIVGNSLTLNLQKLNLELVQINICLGSRKKGMVEFFNQTGYCTWIYDLIGKYDLSVEMYIRNDDFLRDIINEFKEIFFDDIIYYDIAHVYRDIMIDWSPF